MIIKISQELLLHEINGLGFRFLYDLALSVILEPLEDQAVYGLLVGSFEFQVVYIVSHRGLQNQAMYNFAAARPIVENWHVLAHSHDVADDFDAFDNYGDVHERALILRLLLVCGCLVRFDLGQHVGRRLQVQIVKSLLELLSLVNVGNIHSHQVLDPSKRVEDVLLLII